MHSIDEVRERFAAADVFQQGTVLLEEYSRGQELNVMGFVVDGKVRILSVADRNTQIIWDNYIPVLYDVSYPSKFFDIVHGAAFWSYCNTVLLDGRRNRDM